jgi:hypothetical protein
MRNIKWGNMEVPEIKGRNHIESNIPVQQNNVQQSVLLDSAFHSEQPFEIRNLQGLENNLLGEFQRELAFKVWNKVATETAVHANVTVTPQPKNQEYKPKYSFYE